ncbi:acetolactate synthase catalytic subunit [Actinomadura viridis]|uniref:Acetolactate synthase-1/2/3 large subunit n=1 Tax=Actinomadura viridis TaxID=58110 RepID=A0A931DEB4_9ACTN|nr:thiamine pyrophosphate-binding protein [Actinomadura viridis]MBG6085996.1 acetolactate synthase-1/2/3 large subunit [Actinomadura viridis]
MTASKVRNGGHVVAETLERHGVRYVFGQDSPEWLYEALDPERIRAVTMRDERSAGFAADTVARLTGRPTVACGIHGPGALNLMTALLEAQAANSPLVALVSGVETDVHGTGAFQEVDQVAVARPLVKWAVRVERADRIGATVDRALRIAVAGRPGPVLVELPNDVMEQPQPEPSGNALDAASQGVRPASGGAGLAEAARLLAGAARPAILAGGGARSAADIVALAERLAAPVTVTSMGRGAFPETHDLFAGVAGFMSDRDDGSGAVANGVLARADVLLVLGSALDGVTTDGGRLPGPDATIVRVDLDPEAFARGTRPALAIHAGVEAAVAGLLAELDGLTTTESGGAPRTAPAEDLAGAWAAVRAAQERRAADEGSPVHPARLYTALQRSLAPDDVVVCDAAYSSVWALSYLRQGRHFERITYGRAAGTLGFGLPGAIGAATAFPGRRVVALVGDGGFGFGWGELETLARERLQVVCVVLNNGCFAYQKLWHDLQDGTSRWLDFADVRHDRLAEAVGIAGIRVEDAGELEAALDRALALDGPCVVDVRIRPDELPPFNFERHRRR